MEETIIKKYTIYGERCSGTNYLEQLMAANFDISFTSEYGHKHFFGHKQLDKLDTSDTLFICIVRHPITWLNSFFREQHHIPNRPISLDQFLFNTWYSVDDENHIISEDMRISILPDESSTTPYKNIFEMRFYKHYYLLNILPRQVKHYILIQYENLRDNTNAVLNTISTRFNLTPKQPAYVNIHYYKNMPDKIYDKHITSEINIPKSIIFLCWKYLNHHQERRLGYTVPTPAYSYSHVPKPRGLFLQKINSRPNKG